MTSEERGKKNCRSSRGLPVSNINMISWYLGFDSNALEMQ